MATLTSARDRYLEEFEALDRQGALRRPAWLGPLRRAAMAQFAEVGFPTTRDEDWRYTNLAPLTATPFRHADGVESASLPVRTLERLALGAPGWPRLVFVNGRYSTRLSSVERLSAGVRLSSLAEAMDRDGELVERHLTRYASSEANVFVDLNTAFARDGAFLHLPADCSLETPIELLFAATSPGVHTQPRILVVAGPHSRATVVERYVGLTGKPYFTNAVTEIVAAQGASIEHYLLQEQGAGAFHVATLSATLARDSAFATWGATFGGRLSRATLALRFAGEGGQGTLGGLYVVGGQQHVDHHVTVDHAVPRCTSRQLYKGVLDGSARAVFNGRVVVRQGAQKTDANQTNKHLLLSDGVEVDSKPQLEILADDVKCTHGAAEGELAPEAIFYLRSRGLDEAAARALLTQGFAREVIERVAVEAVRAHLERALQARLGRERSLEER